LTYSIFFSEKSKKQLNKLNFNIKERILKKLYSINDNPYPHITKLKGSKFWRLRIEDYRAILDLIITQKKIIVLRIDKISRVYDRKD
jgi:mRNA interferase RelE/StbE